MTIAMIVIHVVASVALFALYIRERNRRIEAEIYAVDIQESAARMILGSAGGNLTVYADNCDCPVCVAARNKAKRWLS